MEGRVDVEGAVGIVSLAVTANTKRQKRKMMVNGLCWMRYSSIGSSTTRYQHHNIVAVQ